MIPLRHTGPATLLIALLLASCAPRPTGVLLDTEATPAARLTRLVGEKSRNLRSLSGSGTITFDAPEISGTAAFTSRLKRPDSLLVFLEGPFGIGLGTLFLSPAKYVLYNSMENLVVTGDPAAGSFRSIIPFELTQEQILDAFAGIFALPQGEPAGYEVEDGLFRLTYACDAGTCEYRVDPDLLLVVEYRRFNAEGALLLEAHGGSPAEEDNAAAPRRITVRYPPEERRLAIRYTRLSLNVPDLSFEFAVPPNARTTTR